VIDFRDFSEPVKPQTATSTPGDGDLLGTLIHEYVHDGTQLLTVLREAIAEGDPPSRRTDRPHPQRRERQPRCRTPHRGLRQDRSARPHRRPQHPQHHHPTPTLTRPRSSARDREPGPQTGFANQQPAQARRQRTLVAPTTRAAERTFSPWILARPTRANPARRPSERHHVRPLNGWDAIAVAPARVDPPNMRQWIRVTSMLDRRLRLPSRRGSRVVARGVKRSELKVLVRTDKSRPSSARAPRRRPESHVEPNVFTLWVPKTRPGMLSRCFARPDRIRRDAARLPRARSSPDERADR
jgi:hypothetical protein